MNERHRLFVEEYLSSGCNAAEAYRRVYGKKIRNPASSGARLLQREDVRRAIERRLDEIKAAKRLTTEKALDVISSISDVGTNTEKIRAINTFIRMQALAGRAKADDEDIEFQSMTTEEIEAELGGSW